MRGVIALVMISWQLLNVAAGQLIGVSIPVSGFLSKRLRINENESFDPN